MKIRFTIPGDPQGKGRPRFNRATGRVFTPSDTLAYERFIRELVREKFPGIKPRSCPIMLRFTATFELPKSATIAQRRAVSEGTLYHTSTPDKDNIEKAILDALNGVVFVDDSQIQGGGIKRYGSPARVDVEFTFLENPVENPAEKRFRKKTEQPSLGLPPPRRR